LLIEDIRRASIHRIERRKEIGRNGGRRNVYLRRI
jgi:hypothetical protein